ncbi:MAG TPA: M3 family metallopeptidase [Gammaproteobacteria bacterium]|nr:M3 family metallopeptidase [Gammaproteobacteria bacterium]
MKTLLLATALSVAAASPYTLDLGRYYPSAMAEQTERTGLLLRVDAFIKQPASSLDTPQAFYGWLSTYDSLSKELRKHNLYVYVRAEEDVDDKGDAVADDTLSAATDRLDDAVREALAALGAERLHGYINADSRLEPFLYFVDSVLTEAAHDNRDRQAVTELAKPALDSLSSAYQRLRRGAVASPSAASLAPVKAFAARWNPYLHNEDAFAALLLPTVSLHNGVAKLQGFQDAPEAAYSRAGLSKAEVRGALEAIRSSAANARFESVVAAAAAGRLHVPVSSLHAWDLDAADAYKPALVEFPDAVPQVLAAEQPMGAEYAGQYSRLFDPAAGRVEWCRTAKCDDSGFSLGYAGMVSSLFYGAYHGSTDNMRAVAHEAGHAVHREFMNENQPLAVYNDGPKFVFESFAIFNEFLFLDHLYGTASNLAARAYYLRQFVDDAAFQIYGSAEETDLEESIYAGVQDGSLRSAADLDALTLKVFSRYTAAPGLQPEMKVYWARNRLYFTDPLYDVNYLYAGLLALEYLRRFETDPRGFSNRYVALLKNGFTDTPQALEKKFLGIDLGDSAGLARDAAEMITRRTVTLESLYAVPAATIP